MLLEVGIVSAEAVRRQQSIAQVRLGRNEWVELRETMKVLGLSSTSQALREALRLLHREARREAMAEGIERYYHGEPAPAPEGALPVSDADIEAADRSEW
jgi:hypothetical protein